jgi:hypothetical protein
MRIVANILRSLWNGWTAAPPAPCCAGCCIQWSNFR